MKSGVSNINKICTDKFGNIKNISNNNSCPSIDLLSYSNNNVYADIVDLDDTETHSLMYSHNNVNAQQQYDRGKIDRALNNSSTRKHFDIEEPSFYISNSSDASRSFGL